MWVRGALGAFTIQLPQRNPYEVECVADSVKKFGNASLYALSRDLCILMLYRARTRL